MTGLRVASLGAGYFAGFHIDAWARIPRARVVGVCDTDPARAGATGLPVYATPDAMIAQARPDILDIVVPPAGHAAAVRLAIAAGVGTVICQKPFCRDLAEAQAVTSEAAAAGIVLIVHENFRFQPWYRAVARALSEGHVGRLLQATFRLRPGDGQGAGAYLDRQPYFRQMPRFLVHETAVHWIDTFRYLLGPATAVYADLRRINDAIAGEDAGMILSDHADGVRALFDGNRHLDHPADNLRRTMGEAWFEGTKGVLYLTGDGAVALRPFGARQARQLLGPDTWPGFGGDCVHALQAHVVAGVLDGAPIENLAADYLEVLRVEEAVYRSARSGAKIWL
ncbi:MAG: Gfo/Idh/MocA family oxidoreductase [Rhodobacteraceae bacterium]|nr:Gfo/Idh/MocA family oxidoreductase [Paracoccaceae bacterium]